MVTPYNSICISMYQLPFSPLLRNFFPLNHSKTLSACLLRSSTTIAKILFRFYYLACLIPTISPLIHRLRDIDKSSWWYLLAQSFDVILAYFFYFSSSNINTSSTVLLKTRAISTASFSDGLYFPFSNFPMVSQLIPLIQPAANSFLSAIHEFSF